MIISQSGAIERLVRAEEVSPAEDSRQLAEARCGVQPLWRDDHENAEQVVRSGSIGAVCELTERNTAIGHDHAGYDEIDRRLLDTFPASDAVARY